MRSATGIQHEFNKFFTNTCTKLAKKPPAASRTFDSFSDKIDTIMLVDSIIINELKEAFFP